MRQFSLPHLPPTLSFGGGLEAVNCRALEEAGLVFGGSKSWKLFMPMFGERFAGFEYFLSKALVAASPLGDYGWPVVWEKE